MKLFKKNPSKIILICLLALILSNIIFFLLVIPTPSQSNDKKDIMIISKGNDRSFLRSLGVDTENFNISIKENSEPLKINPDIDVIIVFDSLLNTTEQSIIENFVDNGGSLLILMGQNLYDNATLLATLQILNNTEYDNYKTKNSENMLFIVGDTAHPISINIDWNSAPEMSPYNMTIIPESSLNTSIQSIIDVYPVSKNLQIELYRQPILMEHEKGNGNIILFTGWLDEDSNVGFRVWPYFNYLLYTMVFESSGESFQKYNVWPFSPVPHFADQLTIGIIVVILGVLAFLLFFIIKKKSSKKIDQDMVEKLKKKAEEEEKRRLEEAKEIEEKIESGIDLTNDWEVIGTHRQLGGFLFTLFIGLILVIPQLLVSNFILPQIIQPYPQAAGWYYYAYNFFQIAWFLFDFGTSYALAKYFAQYRVKQPEKAIHYIQIFVWWQIFTGLIQVSVFAFIGSIIFPQTNLAHMSWVFIIYSFVQYPGFFLVFMFTFQGLQRSDLHLITYVAWEIIWLILGQVLFCYLGRIWGGANPIIGEALGAGIGYSIARFFDYWVTFAMSLILFKRLGYSPSTCFRIDFTREELKESLKYGSKLGIGESFVQLGWFIQVVITSTFVANYSNELGWFNLVYNVGLIVQIVTLYGQSLLGAFSESTAHDKKSLTKLYIYQALRWGNYFAYFLISVLFAVGAKFIIGAAGYAYGGPAVKFLVPILLFHTAGIYSWLADAVFEGTGKTGWLAIAWLLEQTIRAILMFIFVLIFNNMVSVILAYVPAVLVKDLFTWILIRKKISKYKIYPYNTFVTPAISAAVNYILLYFVGELIWAIPLGDLIINTAILFLMGIFLFMYLFAFLDAFLGAYDDNTIKEFERAADLVQTPVIRFFPRSLVKIAKLGCKISPFHNKFKIDIYEIAMKEAYDLTLEKRKLKI
ncbi:MAG: hypothetical protein EU551_01325 [Promethearchaeota archaeon]|nr:MAG: hypothetical protein EU551_01325 [Candidatus Lokiarchaeota archaeon]